MDAMTMTFHADPDLSDVRDLVLRTVEAGAGDTLAASAIAARLGLPLGCVQAVLGRPSRRGRVRQRAAAAGLVLGSSRRGRQYETNAKRSSKPRRR